MFHEVLGQADAPTVLLSAGLGGAAGFWAPQMEALCARFRVIAYDQRGTGRSRQDLPEHYTMASMADDVAEVLDATDTTECVLVGHALGGLIGLELALRHPGRVLGLVLVNAWARLDAHTRHCFEVRTALLDHAGAAAYVRAQPLFLYPAAWSSANRERVEQEYAHGVATFQGGATLRKRLAALQAYDALDRLGEIGCPALVVATRDDLLVPWTASRVLAEGLPGGDRKSVV